jgi:hypothetical protein
MVSADRMAYKVTVAVLHKQMDVIDGSCKSATLSVRKYNYGSKVL